MKNKKIYLLMLIILGCSLKQPILINNEKNEQKIDLKNNGILAFELFEPNDMKVEFWTKNLESGIKYQIDQYIDNGSSWKIGIGPITFYEKINLNENTNRTIYLYQLPPGDYDLRWFIIQHTEYGNKSKYHPKIKTGNYKIFPGKITYIGTTGLWGQWGIPLIRKMKIDFKTIDRFTEVDSVLNTIDMFGIKDLEKEKLLVPIELIK